MEYPEPPDWYTYLDAKHRRTTKDKAVYRQWYVFDDNGNQTWKIEEMPRNT